MLDHPYIHVATFIGQLITLGLLVWSLACIRRLCRERDEAVKQLMLYMDKKTREINANHNVSHETKGV